MNPGNHGPIRAYTTTGYLPDSPFIDEAASLGTIRIQPLTTDISVKIERGDDNGGSSQLSKLTVTLSNFTKPLAEPISVWEAQLGKEYLTPTEVEITQLGLTEIVYNDEPATKLDQDIKFRLTLKGLHQWLIFKDAFNGGKDCVNTHFGDLERDLNDEKVIRCTVENNEYLSITFPEGDGFLKYSTKEIIFEIQIVNPSTFDTDGQLQVFFDSA